MRITERDARQRGLTTIYIPQDAGRVMPSDVGDEIILTHPAQPWSSKLDEMQNLNIVGAASNEFVSGAVPAENHYFYIPWVHWFHNDPTARRLQLMIENFDTSIRVIIFRENAVPQNEERFNPRPLLIPAGFFLRARAQGIAATFSVSMTLSVIDLLVGELAPPL